MIISHGDYIYNARTTLRTAIDYIKRHAGDERRWNDVYIAWLICDDDGVYAKGPHEPQDRG